MDEEAEMTDSLEEKNGEEKSELGEAETVRRVRAFLGCQHLPPAQASAFIPH